MEKPQEVDILDYLYVIWRRAWLILLIAFLTTAITSTISSLLKKKYETEITFRIMGQQRRGSNALSQVPTSLLAALGVPSGEQEMQTYSQVLRSRNIIGRVIDALPYLMEKYPVQQSRAAESGRMRRGLFGKIKGIFEPYDQKIKEQIGEEEFRRRLLLEELRKSIKTRQLGGDVLSVKVRWGDPNEAADIACTLGRVFREYDTLARQEAADSTLGFIQRALRGEEGRDKKRGDTADLYIPETLHLGPPSPEEKSGIGVEQALAEAEQKLRDFKKHHKTVVMQEEARKLIEKFVDAEDALSTTVIARKTSEVRLVDIQRQLAGQDQMVVSAKTVTDNPIVQYLQREMAQLEVQAESLRANFGEANPELKDKETQITEYEKRIGREIPRIVSQEMTSTNPLHQFLRQEEINCLIDITVSKARETAIRRRIAILEEKLMQMPDEEMQLTQLTREVETYNRIYATLRQSENEAQLAKESITTNISILDEPDIPLQPAAPRVMLNTIIGCVLGLMLGLGLAFFLEYIKRTLSPQAFEKGGIG